MMKVKTKRIILFLICLVIISIDIKSNEKLLLNKEPNKQLVVMLKNNNFNLEIYELTFCLNEILYILENDSTYENVFSKRINEAFENRLNESTHFFNAMEYNYFKKVLMQQNVYANIFPKGYRFLCNLNPPVKKSNISYLEAFKNYIKYPEQVDDVCLMTLIYKNKPEIYDSINEDNIAKWRINSWIEYGFEEFRYYPGILNKTKKILNDRIIDFITLEQQSNPHLLVKKILEMISLNEKKYKNQ